MFNIKYRGIFLAFTAMSFAGSFMIPWKIASDHGSPATMVLLLVTIAALANTATLMVQNGWKGLIKKPSKKELYLGILFALLTLAGNWVSAEAVFYLSPAIVSLLMRAEVLFVTLIAWFFLKEKANLGFWVGLLVVGCGFALMQGSAQVEGEWYIGAGFAIASALFFAIMAVITRKYIHSIDPVLVNAVRLWLSVLLWFPLNGALPQAEQFNIELVLYVGLAALLGPSFGRVIFMASARYLEARISALIICGAPVLTLLLGMVLLGEYPSTREVLGGLIMLLGILTTVLLRPRKKPDTVALDET